MARVAVAYVEVRPNLTGFGDKLRAALKAKNIAEQSVKVAVEPDVKGFIGKVRTALKNVDLSNVAAKVNVEPNTGRFASKLKTELKTAGKTAGKQLGQDAGEEAGKTIPRSMFEHLKEATGKSKQKMAAVLSVDAEYAAGRAAASFRSRLAADKLIDADMEHAFVSRLTQMYGTAGKSAGRAAVAEHNSAIKRMAAEDERRAKNRSAALMAALKRTRRPVEREGAHQGKSFAESFSKQMKLGINLRLGQLAPILGAAALTAAPLAQIISSLGAGLVSLGAAASVMAASLGVAGVSALLAFGQAAGAAAFASQGLGDSLKALDNIQTKMAAGIKLTQGDLDNYQEAMARLSPSAQNVVGALGAVNRQLVSVRKTVQERLFAGIADDIGNLATAYLPVLQTQLNATATSLNRTGRSFAAWATQAATVRQVGDVMAGNTRIINQLGSALTPLAGAALTLTQAFQPLGELLSSYVARWAQATNRTVAASQASGRLAGWVDLMRSSMEQAFRIAGNLGRVLGATFTSVLGPGQTLLSLIERLTFQWATWSQSITGRNAMAAWATSALPTLQSLAGLIGDIGAMFSRLAGAGDAAAFVDQLRTILPPLERLLTQLSASNAAGAFAEGLAEIGRALAELGAGGMLADAVELAGWLLHNLVALSQAIPGLTTVISALVGALVAMAAVRLVATITGLRQIPLLIASFGAANTALRAFNTTWLATQAGFGMSRVGVIISNFRALGATLTTTTGLVQVLRGAMQMLWASMLSNPIGWILVGLGALATAIFAISNASRSGTEETIKLDNALTRVGARTIGAQVAADLNTLNHAAGGAADAMLKYGRVTDEATAKNMAAATEWREVTNASQQMANTYGRNVDTIVGNLRAWGVAETTSSGEIVVAMQRVIEANGGVALSTEEMSNVLAGIYGVMGKDYGNMANTFAGLQAQLANGYGEIGAAALDSAQTQIAAMLLVLKTAGGMGGYMSREFEAQLAGIDEARKVLAKQAGDVGGAIGGGVGSGIGGALDRAGAGAKNKAKKQGKQTAAGWITSFTAQIAELKPEYLFRKSAAWTKVGSNIATYLAKGITSGSKNISLVSRYIAKNFGKTYVRQIQAEIGKYRAALTVFDPITGKKQGKQFWEDRLTEIKDFKQKAIDALTSGADLVNYFGFIPTPQEVQGRMSDVLAKMREFTEKLAALQERGLSKELARAWLEAGYDTAGNLVNGLQDATADQIGELNETFKTITTEAQATAEAQSIKFFGMGQSQVESVIRGINSKTAAATAAVNTLMARATAAAKGKLNWTQLGVDAMNGFNSGVTSAAGGISSGVGGVFSGIRRSQMTVSKTLGKDLANALVKGYEDEIKRREKNTSKIINNWLKAHKKEADKTLGAHSPSKVYAELGRDTVAGYMIGIEQMQAATLQTVSDLYSSVSAVTPAELTPTLTPITPAYATPATYGATAGTTPQVDVKVYVGDRELTDIVRVEVNGIDNTRARALLAGRRGG